MRRFELDSLAWLFRLFGVGGVTAAVGDNLLIASPGHRPILAFISPSCSSLMGILALGTLAVAVLRGRRGHTVVAYVVSAVALFVLNLGRMAASCVAGLWFGRGALLLFHDWVGTVWNFVATLLGFLLLLYLTLPSADRAEQDRYGRHIARRPESWTHAGLGYRVPAVQRVRANRRSWTGWLIRYFLPASTRRWLARRRESDRIDFRIGFLNVDQRRAAIAELSANGLEPQGASLMALAVFEEDASVLDALARAVFSHANDHVTSDRPYLCCCGVEPGHRVERSRASAPCHRSARSCSSAFVPGPLLDDERESVSDSCRVRPIDPLTGFDWSPSSGIRVLRITRARYSVSQRARRTTTSSKPSSKRSPSVNGSQSRTRVWRRCDYGRGRGSCLIDSRCYRYPNSTSPRPLSPSVRTPSGNGALTSNW